MWPTWFFIVLFQLIFSQIHLLIHFLIKHSCPLSQPSGNQAIHHLLIFWLLLPFYVTIYMFSSCLENTPLTMCLLTLWHSGQILVNPSLKPSFLESLTPSSSRFPLCFLSTLFLVLIFYCICLLLLTKLFDKNTVQAICNFNFSNSPIKKVKIIQHFYLILWIEYKITTTY